MALTRQTLSPATSTVTGTLADGGETLFGGIGDDLLTGGVLADVLHGSDGNDVLRGEGGNDLLDGGAGRDLLIGGGGHDALVGGLGSDTLDGGEGDDLLDGGANNDSMLGGTGNDTLRGGTSNDTLRGGIGNDLLEGGTERDRLFGEDGADTLVGGAGEDTMTGGVGNDVFRFDRASDSPGERFDPVSGRWIRDTITDFGRDADKIDLRGIDADLTTPGDQAFDFIGFAYFDGTPGQLSINKSIFGDAGQPGRNVVSADITGDGVADFEIEVFDVWGQHLISSDFLL